MRRDMGRIITSGENADYIAMRASELAIEQQARFLAYQVGRPRTAWEAFYTQPKEVEASKSIVSFMQHYAVLKGFVQPNQELKVTRPVGVERGDV